MDVIVSGLLYDFIKSLLGGMPMEIIIFGWVSCRDELGSKG